MPNKSHNIAIVTFAAVLATAVVFVGILLILNKPVPIQVTEVETPPVIETTDKYDDIEALKTANPELHDELVNIKSDKALMLNEKQLIGDITYEN